MPAQPVPPSGLTEQEAHAYAFLVGQSARVELARYDGDALRLALDELAERRLNRHESSPSVTDEQRLEAARAIVDRLLRPFDDSLLHGVNAIGLEAAVNAYATLRGLVPVEAGPSTTDLDLANTRSNLRTLERGARRVLDALASSGLQREHFGDRGADFLETLEALERIMYGVGDER